MRHMHSNSMCEFEITLEMAQRFVSLVLYMRLHNVPDRTLICKILCRLLAISRSSACMVGYHHPSKRWITSARWTGYKRWVLYQASAVRRIENDGMKILRLNPLTVSLRHEMVDRFIWSDIVVRSLTL